MGRAISSPRLSPSLGERALLVGAQSLCEVELLAVLVDRAVPGVSAYAAAGSLLEAAGGLLGVARMGPHRIANHRGLGPKCAAMLVAAFELGQRVCVQQWADERETVGSFESVAAWARPRLAHLEHEEVWLLALDGQNGLLSTRRIAQGGLHGCALTPRDVLRPALRDCASGIVLVHNHPSGDPTPSSEDVEMTRAVMMAGDVVGVPVLDHVVVATQGAQSLLELGVLGR